MAWFAFPLLAMLVLGACSENSGFRLTTASADIMALRTGSRIERTSPAGSYLAGLFALDHGEIELAASELASALEADPENLELHRQVFLLRIATGKEEAARAAAEELVELDPSADEAWLLLGVDHLRHGRLADARAAFEAIGARGVPGILAPILEAWMLYAQGEAEAALERMPVAQREDGFAPLHTDHRAALMALLGRTREARALLDDLVTRSRPVADRIARMVASLDAELGEWDSAQRLLQEQIELRGAGFPLVETLSAIQARRVPEMPIRDARTGAADAIFGLAGLLHDQRILGQALVYARLASFLAPEAGDIHYLTGETLLTQDAAERAIDAFDAVPADSPYAWEARLGKAEALDALDRDDEAIALLRAMAAERPERIDPLVTLGDWLRRDERFAEAEQAYTEALERIGELRRTHWRLLYARGIARERTGRWSEAEADFLKALELEPDQPYVLNYLGYSWVDQGVNLDQAKAMLHRAVDLRPDDGFIVDSLGWAYYRLGDYERAVEYLERAVELEPEDPVINDHLGDAYWRVGRLREARFQWQRALIFEPERDQVAQIERKLESGLPETDAERG